MPVPKQKQGRIRTHTRRSAANMKIPGCGSVHVPPLRRCRFPHHVPQLRFPYKDREVIVTE